MISNEIRIKAFEIVEKMTNEQKASLLIGKDFWNLNGVEELGLPSVMVTDGPHGLRKQVGDADHVGLNDSHPATCFPTASATACSFDRELLYQIGEALAAECLNENVAVLLGPGINHKRSPLCGRNFEYFSEDPLLTGQLAAFLVSGLQSKGVGACVKHFAANSQETMRLTSDSVIDERTLHEIYLKQFEIVVKECRPLSMMTAYNRLNGEYCSESELLLEKIAREKWGFDGLFVTDWGALNNVIDSFKNGLDLEMPGLCKGTDGIILDAIEKGEFEVATLDKIAVRLVSLMLHYSELKNTADSAYSKSTNLKLAQKAAEESAVLLKNDNALLPLKSDGSFALIGNFAKTPRYQGAGSSKVKPSELDNTFDELTRAGITFDYADGYLPSGETDNSLIEAAKKAALNKDAVIIFAGLPDKNEAEGFDRKTLDMPSGHNRLIYEIAKVNPNIAVVLQCGSAVTMPWLNSVKAVLLSYLAGCQGGKATANLLLGNVNPCGKLAETFPLSLADTPANSYYLQNGKICEYRESIYTGYRYYDSAEKEVLFPFGHGLSYTSFEYSNLKIECVNADLDNQALKNDGHIRISLSVKNTGTVKGKETVQLYISHLNPSIFKAKKELKDFYKVTLESGETKAVSFELDFDDFSYYNVNIHDWHVQSGDYKILIAASSRNIKLENPLKIENSQYVAVPDYKISAPAYYNLNELAFIPQEQFEVLLGHPVPLNLKPKKPYTQNVTFNELAKASLLFKMAAPFIKKQAAKQVGDDKESQEMAKAMIMDMPVRSFGMAGGIKKGAIEGIVDIVNGHPIRGYKKIKQNTIKKD